ncbi:MAG: hypothetical protein IK066_11120 [Kiritimatiellae bacterium]|nr:hypothetical protein [Kiritimatiellia bacterium]
MKVKPVAKETSSPIPTAAEAAANPSLVAPAPSAKARRGMGALVGAGLLGSLFAPVAGCIERDGGLPAATPTTVRAIPNPADAEVAIRAEAAREAVATVVAPILQKALDEEGRGAFGCVAIDPPYVLPEIEAYDLIVREFAKAGVTLRRGCIIDGFTRTIPDKDKPPVRDEKHFCPVYPAKTVRESWKFDLGTEDGSVAVEFLTPQDERRESFETLCSTVIDFNLPALAKRLRADFSTRTDGNPVAVGVFFDPLVSTAVWDGKQKKRVPRPGSSFAALSGEEWEAVQGFDEENGRKRRALLNRDARELLLEQVRHFIDWAREEGKIQPEKGN